MVTESGRAEWDRHGFFVEYLHAGRTHWSDAAASAEADLVERCRAGCNCGWRGRDIRVDQKTSLVDQADFESAYDAWDREHVPDFVLRNPQESDSAAAQSQP